MTNAKFREMVNHVMGIAGSGGAAPNVHIVFTNKSPEDGFLQGFDWIAGGDPIITFVKGCCLRDEDPYATLDPTEIASITVTHGNQKTVFD